MTLNYLLTTSDHFYVARKKRSPARRTPTKKGTKLKKCEENFQRKKQKPLKKAHVDHYKDRLKSTKKIQTLGKNVFPDLKFDQIFNFASNFQNTNGEKLNTRIKTDPGLKELVEANREARGGPRIYKDDDILQNIDGYAVNYGL